jgi:hypothetical protein
MEVTVKGVAVKGDNVQAWVDVQVGNMRTEDVMIGVDVTEGDFVANARDDLIRAVQAKLSAPAPASVN